jgi:hypothetical protein
MEELRSETYTEELQKGIWPKIFLLLERGLMAFSKFIEILDCN